MIRAVLFLTIALLFAQSPMAAGAGAKAEITAIKALLFDDRSGELSKDVLSQSDPDIPELQNITAWSHSTLVLVEISGPPKQLAASSRVNFVATYKAWTPGRDTPPADRTVRQGGSVGRFSDKGKTYVGFWLYDTGCFPVQISGALSGDPKSKREAGIPFACGD